MFIVHCVGTSWGFSIVGGAEPGSDRSPEPVHVLFVVPESPAAKVIIDEIPCDAFITIMLIHHLTISAHSCDLQKYCFTTLVMALMMAVVLLLEILLAMKVLHRR